MTIESLFTTQNQTTQNKTTLGISGNAPIGFDGLSFIDMILTGMIEQQGKSHQTSDEKTQSGPLDSDNPVLSDDPSLDPSVLLAENSEITDDVENYYLDGPQEIETTVALNQKAFDEIMMGGDSHIDKALTDLNNTPQPVDTPEEFPDILEAFFIDGKDAGNIGDRLKTLLNKLKNMDGNDIQLSNLTPAQIEDLKSNLADLPDSEFNQLMVGLVQLLPPQTQQNVIITQDSLIIASGPLTGEQINQLQPANDVTSRLNALLIQKVDPRYQAAALPDEGLPTDSDFDTFDHLLKQFAANEKQDGKSDAMGSKGQQVHSEAPGVSPNLSFLQGWPFTMNGSLYLASNWAFGIDEYGAQNAGSIINNTAQFANLVTQAQSAGQAHPATQMVAATIKKSGANGENRNISIRLDPPDLGRVEVRMEFTKGKAEKATIISEKPETHLMLQRDSQLLDRALQDAGMDADGSGLNFELANEQHDFNHNGGHDGQGPMGRGPDGQDGEEELIETTMTWDVNPETGHTSYNILV